MIGRRNRKHGSPNDQGSSDPRQQLPPTNVDVPARLPRRVRTRGVASEEPGVAEVVGSTAVPQIIIGSPSPTVEPSTIGKAYSSLPFRPDVVIDGWSTDTMTVRGASLRGHLHRYNGAPRQDDFAVHHLPDGRIIVLVADGVSGAPQSHIGASTVIKQAADWLHTNLGCDVAGTDWSALLKSAAWALTERAQALLGLDAPDPRRAEEELATTLVCGVIEPTGPRTLRAHLVSAGDSAAWLLSAGEFLEIVAGKTVPDGGVASSAVVGLPRLPIDLTPRVVEFGGNDVLLVATDGIGDPLGDGYGGVGNLFREVLTRPSPPSLIEFAHAVDFSRETFDDDRTLVAVWPRQQPPQEATGRRRRPSEVEGLR
jgi:serine/threonine protein phosphatase PrpC